MANKYKLEVRKNPRKDGDVYPVYTVGIDDTERNSDYLIMADDNCSQQDVELIRKLVRLANKQIRSEARHGKE